MIELTKLNDSKLVINSDLIECIEAHPDSFITLTTGLKIMVKESIPEILDAIIEFRRSIRREANIHAVKPPSTQVAVLSQGSKDSKPDSNADK